MGTALLACVVAKARARVRGEFVVKRPKRMVRHAKRAADSWRFSGVEALMEVSVPRGEGKSPVPNQTGRPSLSGCVARFVFVTRVLWLWVVAP